MLEVGITYVRNAFICKVFREAGYIEKSGPDKKSILPQERALELIKSRGSMSIRDLSQEITVSRASAGRILKVLVDKKLIESHEKGPATLYAVMKS